MGKRIKIAVICPIPEDPTSFYRGIGPLAMLQKTYENIDYLFPNPVNWCAMKLADILFLQRPCNAQHFQCLAMAKDNGIPVWVDFDDDNLAVPEDNPMYPHYCTPEVKDSIVKIARNADVVTVSTQFMKDKYSIYNDNVILIPNAIDDGLLHLHEEKKKLPKNDLVLWRGTPTHNSNLEFIENDIVEISQKFPKWRFVFQGYKPLRILRRMKNAEHYAIAGDIITFLKTIVAIPSKIMYYPLAENDHSLSRSHVSWLEGTLCGNTFVGPNLSEFKKPGITNFDNGKEFQEAISTLINNPDLAAKNLEESWQYILDNLRLSQVNEKRAELIKKLLNITV